MLTVVEASGLKNASAGAAARYVLDRDGSASLMKRFGIL